MPSTGVSPAHLDHLQSPSPSPNPLREEVEEEKTEAAAAYGGEDADTADLEVAFAIVKERLRASEAGYQVRITRVCEVYGNKRE